MNHGPDDQGPEGLDSDELALRRILHQAVEEIEPRDGTLDHLRRAVPARRARKRQALVGAAAAVLFLGTAVPALVHVSNSTGSSVNSEYAGHGEQAQGGAGQGKETEGGESTSGGSSGKTEDKGKGSEKEKDEDTGAGTGSGTGGSDDPSAAGPADVTPCTADQLGTSGGTTAAPDSSGTVYGTFRFSNISATDCTVSSPGGVNFITAGAADSSKITTSRHVGGDAAAGLPDPSQELTSLVLKPGAAYEVRFAWIPSETCPTTTDPTEGPDDPTPTPTPTENPTGTTEGTSTGGDTGTSTQLMAQDTTADGSVTVTNTAEAGAPTATALVSNACAGIIYYTGVLAGA
ncbi:hypothetical protein J7F01_00125 [Streptomyces sp. ISL-22]|uniref:hypothetical protein n=1 Tax=unclassified Streptomyces TaxID=2593676 RepID=UPI001BE52234|nr:MULTISPECIES: hypothetical protein [unclassified Streptomyces]MBT2416995.1 hypothetical protein [Streptomyces sp. ISL-24]MBT2430631.1 hypothetical protein [Streptomyces sp. ISL-22]